jgi:hypothetical protein
MTSSDYKDLDNALALLHDFISNYGAKAEDYAILNNAEDVLRGYISCGGEQAPQTVTEKLKEFFESQDPSKLMEALRCS